MIRIASLRELDAAVHRDALGLHPTAVWIATDSGLDVKKYPAYSTSPAASYALETKMRDFGWNWHMTEFRRVGEWTVDLNRADNTDFAHTGWHASRFVAMCLAALAALGVELDLVGEWDKQ